MTWRALSIIQPWAWLIVRPDVRPPAERAFLREVEEFKDVENRTWATDVRGWVLVHASASKLAKWKWTAAALFAAKRRVTLPLQLELPRGAFVGAMRVDGCEPFARSPWFTNEGAAHRIGASVPFLEPIAHSGALGYFDVLRETGNYAPSNWLRSRLAEQLVGCGLGKEFGLS